jgi:hypothetical protein
VCDLSVVHGFAELRSPVTNASKHVGYKITVSFDLADFFDTVDKVKHGKPMMAIGAEAKLLWYKNTAKQGLPTSPIVANIAAAPMDQQILDWLFFPHPGDPPRTVYRTVYTRYADDLTISFDGAALIPQVLAAIPKIVESHGFKVNPKKTHVQFARSGRRIITGIGVDDSIHPTRAFRRRLRAAIHNAKYGRVKHFPRRQWTRYTKVCRNKKWTRMNKKTWLLRWLNGRVKGLQEWAKLTPPNTGRRSAMRIATTYDAGDALAELSTRQTSQPQEQTHELVSKESTDPF